MNLYHLDYATDREALQALTELRDMVHAHGGYLWTSLSHGQGPAYVVVALPVGVTISATEQKQAAGFTSDFSALQVIDPYGPTSPVDMTAAIQAAIDEAAAIRLVPVETPEETHSDESTPLAG